MPKRSPGTKNSWIVDQEKSVLHSPFIEVFEQSCHSSEDQRQARFYVMKSRDWANVIPVTEDGKVVLVRQWRQGVREHSLEIPGGVMDADDQDFQAAAIREMTEETGYEPLPGARCLPVSATYTNPALLNNRCHGFVVGPVRRARAQKLDAGEMIEVVEIPIDEIPALVLARGGIEHALIAQTLLALAFRETAGADLLKAALKRFTQAPRAEA